MRYGPRLTEQRANGRWYARLVNCLRGHLTQEEAVRCHREVRNAKRLNNNSR